MSDSQIREYLQAIGNLLEEQAHVVSVEDQEDGPVLMMTGASPLEEGKEIGYAVSIEEEENGFWLFHLLITPFDPIAPELFPAVQEVIAAMAPSLTLGSYILIEEGGVLMFRHGFLLHEMMMVEDVSRYLLRDLELLEKLAVSSGQWFLRLFRGESSVSEITAALTEV